MSAVDLPADRGQHVSGRCSSRDDVCASYLDMSVTQTTVSDEVQQADEWRSRDPSTPSTAATDAQTPGSI